MDTLKRFNARQLWGAFALVWIGVVALYVHHRNIQQAHQFADGLYSMCARVANNASDLAKCEAERGKHFNLSNPEKWADPAIFGVITFIAAAIYIYVGYYLLASLIIGIRTKVGWAQRSQIHRIVICASAVFIAINAIAIYVISANVALDRKVPVSVPGDISISVSSGYASAKGTWVRKVNLLGEDNDEPLSTTYMECFQDKMMCAESTATIEDYGGGPYLSLDQSVHDISRWDGNIISIAETTLCSDETFELNGNASTLVHDVKPTDSTASFCKPPPGEARRSEHYELSKGFDVYWAMRQSARPRLLKAIQALFGN